MVQAIDHPLLMIGSLLPSLWPRCVAISTTSSLYPRDSAAFERSWQRGDKSWVAKWEDNVVGYLLVSVHGDVADIIDIVVDLPYQRRGIGRQLLVTGLQSIFVASAGALPCVFLEVGVRNQAAIALYQSLGFVKKSRRSAYYLSSQGAEDAWSMCLAGGGKSGVGPWS